MDNNFMLNGSHLPFLKETIECAACGHATSKDGLMVITNESQEVTGEFEMTCENCKQQLKVHFYNVFYFMTEKKERE